MYGESEVGCEVRNVGVHVCVNRRVYVCACLCVERVGYVFGDMVVGMSVCVQILWGECGDTRE